MSIYCFLGFIVGIGILRGELVEKLVWYDRVYILGNIGFYEFLLGVRYCFK